MDDGTPSLAALAGELRHRHAIGLELDLRIGSCCVRVESNSAELIERLRRYFRYFSSQAAAPDIIVTAIEASAPAILLKFRDWPRDPGKVGRKDEFADIDGGRVVRKVRTGMQFLVSRREKIAVGPCLANDNQVINFVNSQYVSWLLHRGWVLCHASAVVHSRRGLAIAAAAGGGKSTLALHLMTKGVGFSSNDRLLVQGTPAGTWMSGIPKLPRINPGTALNNPRLRSILSPERRAELAGLDEDDLWGLEEKYDVFIDEAFPESRFVLTSPLVALVILDWRRGSTVPAHFTRVDLNARRDLLAAVMKAPGPFYEPGPGETPVIGSSAVLDPAPYLRNLRGVDVWEVTGGVDFDAATRACMKLLGGETDGP